MEQAAHGDFHRDCAEAHKRLARYHEEFAAYHVAHAEDPDSKVEMPKHPERVKPDEKKS